MLLRSIPEYLLAFLLLAMLGPTPWTAIVALALHNAGILGRDSAPRVSRTHPSGLHRRCAPSVPGRMQIAAWSFVPELLPRLLLYFSYRWETCVREATVLGLLGIVSLGFWIERRAGSWPDGRSRLLRRAGSRDRAGGRSALEHWPVSWIRRSLLMRLGLRLRTKCARKRSLLVKPGRGVTVLAPRSITGRSQEVSLEKVARRYVRYILYSILVISASLIAWLGRWLRRRDRQARTSS